MNRINKNSLLTNKTENAIIDTTQKQNVAWGETMAKYIAKRLMQTLLLMVLVSAITYFLVELIPGDRVFMTYGEGITREEYEIYYRQMGLDQPVVFRYLNWLKMAVRGNLGVSTQYKQQVEGLLALKMPITIYLSVLSGLISLPLGILMGVLCATHRGKMTDTILTCAANIISCLPGYWIALLMMFLFSLKLHWLPSYGFTWFWVDGVDHLRKLIMPLFCLTIGEIAGICRQTRSSVLECIRQDYVRTARAKGLSEGTVIRVHVMRNALIPIVTLAGSRLAGLIGGALFVESVFSIPGMGSLLQTAITSKDLPVMIAIVCMTALVSGIAYLLTDLAYLACDPRITLTND